MPKKAATARNGAQRTRPKTQKSFELVRPESAAREREAEESATLSTSTATAVATQPEPETAVQATIPLATELAPKASTKITTSSTSKSSTKAATAIATQTAPKAQEGLTVAPAGSASARLAARRQASQRMQQRSASALITSEHFAYVRKDLIRIALFAVVMFAAIIVLYLTLGRA